MPGKEGAYLQKSKKIVIQALYICVCISTLVVNVPKFKMPVLCLIILRLFSSFFVISSLTIHYQMKLKKGEHEGTSFNIDYGSSISGFSQPKQHRMDDEQLLLV